VAAWQTRSYSHRPAASHAYWLPPHGVGNGFSARAWAPIADLSEQEAFAMLSSCAAAGIAAFISPRNGGRPQRGPVVYRAWVDSEHFGAAEDALRHAVNEVRDRRQGQP
jgi:hypothetical protein